MSTDLRALCADLHQALERRADTMEEERLLDRSAAALRSLLAADGPAAGAGQPSPTQTPAKGPTRQELRQLFRDQSGYIDDEQVMWIDDFCAAASVVLARWGNHSPGATKMAAPVPVPVTERLPGPEDCDAKGRCWLTSTAPGTFPGWILDDPEQCVDWDRWLPAHALPLPAQGGKVQP